MLLIWIMLATDRINTTPIYRFEAVFLSVVFISSALHCYLLFSVSEDWEVTTLALCLHASTDRAWNVMEMLFDLHSESLSEHAEVTKGLLRSAAG